MKPEENALCEKCGAVMEVRKQSTTEGVFCPSCGWAVVTSHVPEMLQDITKYKMYLLSADPQNKEQLKAVSGVANVNFLQAKKMSQEERPLVVEDEALAINEARKTFDKLSIRYEIEPTFPY